MVDKYAECGSASGEGERSGNSGNEAAAAAAQAQQGFQVVPLNHSPHLKSVKRLDEDEAAHKALFQAGCADCGSTRENWLCLSCHQVRCSRYVSGHAAAHAESHQQTTEAADGGGGGASSHDHQIAISLSDLSIWDFGQDAYLNVFAIPELQDSYSK